jgi:hypothetical protein
MIPRRSFFSRCALGALAFAVSPACVADSGDGSMLILFNTVPTASDTGCTIPTEEGGSFRQSGRIDVLAPDVFSAASYELYPIVESRLESLGDEAQRTIAVHGAEVTLQSTDGALNDEFTRVFSGSLRPGGQTSFSVQVVDAEHLRSLSVGENETVTIIASVKIFGDLQGSEIESDPFDYPIDVCNGCLIGLLGDCDSLPSDFDARTGGECNAFQDGPLDCCTLNGEDICPAISTAPTI